MIVTSTAAAQVLQILAQAATSPAPGEESSGTATSVRPPRPHGNPFGQASPEAAAAILELKTNVSVSVGHLSAEKAEGMEHPSSIDGGQVERGSPADSAIYKVSKDFLMP